jgi:ketosteroid isomerase-like protein
MDSSASEIVSLERSALDRWSKLDPSGYLELSAADITYFDPTTDARVNGVDTLRQRVAGIKDVKLPFTNPRYEMLDPKVQGHGDVAVLTYNLVNYGQFPDGAERVVSRWNATQVYGRTGGKWAIVHTHWSFVHPEIKQPGS